MVRPAAVQVHGVKGRHGPTCARKEGQVNAKFVMNVGIEQAEIDKGTCAVLVGRDGHRVAVQHRPEELGSCWFLGLNAHVGPAPFLHVVDPTAPSDGR